MRVMLKRVGLLTVFLWMGICSAQTGRPTGSFDVIVGISALNGETTAKEIRLLLKDSAQLAFKGYCENQQCVMLKANHASFSSAQAVVDYLKGIYSDRILGYKQYAVADFFKHCTFPEEAEYQYFKKNYGK